MRHQQRHVHATIVKYLTDELAAQGWINAPVNFATTPVTVLDYEPQQAGETPAYNTVAISIEAEGEEEAFELGGLCQVEYTLFVDVYGINEPIGIAIAGDLKDALKYANLQLLDFTQSPPVPTEGYIEFEHVLIEVVPTATTTLDKRSWRVVKATAVTFF